MSNFKNFAVWVLGALLLVALFFLIYEKIVTIERFTKYQRHFVCAGFRLFPPDFRTFAPACGAETHATRYRARTSPNEALR